MSSPSLCVCMLESCAFLTQLLVNSDYLIFVVLLLFDTELGDPSSVYGTR